MEIPKKLEELQSVDLKNPEHYIKAFRHLLFLKKVAQISDLERELKYGFQLSIEQLTTVLYMEALARFSEFQ